MFRNNYFSIFAFYIMQKQHEKYMLRCIELAKKGMGEVSPNPMVGSVVVYKNKIIGEGYHRKYGEAHAEVNAINSVRNTELLKKSTIYVSLEPCSHYGKTPPCTDLIIEKKIPEIIIGSIDPNDKVSGKGIEKLKNAGLKIITGISENDCIKLNRRFYTYHIKKRPYIIFKWAQTKDGFIDIQRKANKNSTPEWITNEYCRTLVHKWRTEEDAFMVGTKTVLIDNPQLTARNWSGRNPVRVIIDKNLQIPKSFKIFDNKAKTIILNSKENKQEKNIFYVKTDFEKNAVQNIIKVLYEHKIQSVVIEGGAFTLNEFIKENLWDEARIFTGNKYFKTGIKAPDFDFPVSENYLYDDISLKIYKNPANEFYR